MQRREARALGERRGGYFRAVEEVEEKKYNDNPRNYLVSAGFAQVLYNISDREIELECLEEEEEQKPAKMSTRSALFLHVVTPTGRPNSNRRVETQISLRVFNWNPSIDPRPPDRGAHRHHKATPTVLYIHQRYIHTHPQRSFAYKHT